MGLFLVSCPVVFTGGISIRVAFARWGTIPLGRNGAQKAVGETSRKSKGRRLSVRLQRAVPVRKEGSVLGRYRI